MNQIVGSKEDGSKFLALVLEPGNLHRLRLGQPVVLRVEDLFPEGTPKKLELALFFSETPISDARELAGMADVVLDERTPVTKTKRPHCPECKSTIEQLGMLRSDSPVDVIYCPTCGCTLGVLRKATA
jgi:hypothetical protein